ncbi:MAG: hypothetical protein FWB74_01905 [Defluviitaleaceae bacterium]|nr:hypothetical protein [Defluviitaleaceae bacterium]
MSLYERDYCPKEGYEVFMQDALGHEPKCEAAPFNHHQGSIPRTAPPQHIPKAHLARPGHDAIQSCLYKNTYLWLNNHQQFWFFPTFIGKSSICGYKRINDDWQFMGFGIEMIEKLYC